MHGAVLKNGAPYGENLAMRICQIIPFLGGFVFSFSSRGRVLPVSYLNEIFAFLHRGLTLRTSGEAAPTHAVPGSPPWNPSGGPRGFKGEALVGLC